MTDEQARALNHFAKQAGRTWKEQLRNAWMKSLYPHYCLATAHILQGLRNSPDFGPKGLAKYKIK